MIRLAVMVLVMLSVVGTVGCGGDVTKYPFRDMRGRECVLTCEDGECDLDCDGESSRECSGRLPRPCLTLAVDMDTDPGSQTGTQSLCDACCAEDGGPSTWSPEHCLPLVCDAASDCPPLGGDFRCDDGRCQRDYICVEDPPPGEPRCEQQ